MPISSCLVQQIANVEPDGPPALFEAGKLDCSQHGIQIAAWHSDHHDCYHDRLNHGLDHLDCCLDCPDCSLDSGLQFRASGLLLGIWIAVYIVLIAAWGLDHSLASGSRFRLSGFQPGVRIMGSNRPDCSQASGSRFRYSRLLSCISGWILV